MPPMTTFTTLVSLLFLPAGDYIAELRRQRKQLEVQLAGDTPPSPRRKGQQEEHALSLLLSDLRRLLQQPPSPNFPATLLSSPLDGLGLLLDLLKLVQLCQANTGHKERGLSQAVFKRALGDEYEILGCIKEAVQTEAGLERLAQHGSGLFTVSVCVMSNFSKSRVLALQVLTEMCSLAAGHTMVADSVAMLRLRFGEPVRFKFIVGEPLNWPPRTQTTSPVFQGCSAATTAAPSSSPASAS